MAELWQVGPAPAKHPAPAPGLFGSPLWAQVIEGLGCDTVLAWNRELDSTVVVPVFRRGPLRIGFLGFPIVGGPFDALSTEQFDRHATELASTLKLDVVRSARCGLLKPQPGHCLPEVWTDDLASWPGPLAKKLTRDLAFAERACTGITIQIGGGDPAAWHALYERTVRAHGGKSRYTSDYFHRLAAADDAGAMLRVVHAGDADGRTLGFAVLAMDQGSGYYLHGGVADSARRQGLSDLLLWQVMSLARDLGMRRFSLMASPAAQTGLVRFKRKWADQQGYSVTRDIGRGIAGKAVLGAMSLRARFLSTRRRQDSVPDRNL